MLFLHQRDMTDLWGFKCGHFSRECACAGGKSEGLHETRTQRSPSLRHVDWGRLVGLQARQEEPGSRGKKQTLKGLSRATLPDKFQHIIFPNSLVCICVCVGGGCSAGFSRRSKCSASEINCHKIRPWCFLVSVSFSPLTCPLGMLYPPGQSSVTCETVQNT